MKKHELLEALDSFDDTDDVFVWVDCNDDCYAVLGVGRVYENPSDMCSRGVRGDGDTARLSLERTDWTPAVGIEVGF